MSEFESLKPRMESAESIDRLPIPCIVTPKLDGEFQVLLYRSGEAAMVNRWGRTREVPALRDLEGSLGKRGIVDAMMLAELHTMENDRPMRLPDLLHWRVADPERLKLAIFDLVKVDGKDPPGDYVWSACASYWRLPISPQAQYSIYYLNVTRDVVLQPYVPGGEGHLKCSATF